MYASIPEAMEIDTGQGARCARAYLRFESSDFGMSRLGLLDEPLDPTPLPALALLEFLERSRLVYARVMSELGALDQVEDDGIF